MRRQRKKTLWIVHVEPSISTLDGVACRRVYHAESFELAEAFLRRVHPMIERPNDARRLGPSLAAVQAGDGRRDGPDTAIAAGINLAMFDLIDRALLSPPARAWIPIACSPSPSAFRPRQPAVHNGHDFT